MTVYYHEGGFPPKSLDWERIAPYLAAASSELARYDSLLRIIPDRDVLLSPLMTAEAANSSRIEGTRATMSDVLAYEAGMTSIDPEKRNDIQEVINYRNAALFAEKELRKLPLTGRVLKKAHEILLHGVRGELKSPGRYRIDKVWIGPNNNIADARYMPPNANDVPSAMTRWESYVNDEKEIPLIKTAVAHAEFESIHPFADGNGRMGRIAIPLMLEMDEVISGPCFYLSEFFEHKNSEYQDRLLAVSKTNEWTEWCIFFLDAVATQARENSRKANGVFELYNEITEYLASKVRSDSAIKVAPYLFSMPIFPTTIFTNSVGLTQSTAKRIITALKEEGKVIELKPHKGSKPAVLAFPELLRIVENVNLVVDQ